MAASGTIVSSDPKTLNPVLWETLPRELLLLVFARLPVSDIPRLCFLSKEWGKDMATANSEINQACQEANPGTMVALLSHSSANAFSVTIYDITNHKWQHDYELHLQRPWNDDLEHSSPHNIWTPMDACDGGLMCFISLWKPTERNRRFNIVVVNLLTRVQQLLPPLHYDFNPLPSIVSLSSIVQIKMDFDTKCYKVVVVAYKRGGFMIDVYDSGTRQWTRAAPPCGFIFGPIHNWSSGTGSNYRLLSIIPGAYDIAEGRLERYYKDNPVIQKPMIDFVIEKNRMFVLQKHTQMDASHDRGTVHQDFHLTEYHLENQTKAWVRGKSYKCPFFEEQQVVEHPAMDLIACDGFLMVLVHHGWRSQCNWLLDLATCKWSKLPANSYKVGQVTRSLLCKALWNVIP